MFEKPKIPELKESDENVKMLATESLNLSIRIFEEAGVIVYGGESGQSHAILAAGILEGRHQGLESEVVRNMAVQALKIANNAFAEARVKTYGGEHTLARAHLAKSILEQLLSDHKKHSKQS